MRQETLNEVRILPDGNERKGLLWTLRQSNLAMAIASPLIILVLWETLVRFGVLDARFFPAPSDVVRQLFAMLASGELLLDLGYTLSRVVIGFLLGAIPGVLLGLAMGLSPALRAFLQPAISSIYPVPKIALFPLAMMLFGIGEGSKWVIVAVSVFFQVLLSTLAGVVNIERIYLDVAADFRASRWQAYRTIALPAALPYIFTGFQLGLGMALIVVVIAENFGTTHGIGYIIWSSWQVFEVGQMYVGLIVVAILGYLSQQLMLWLERVLLPWKNAHRSSFVS